MGVLIGPNALSADAAGVLGMVCVLGAALSYGLSALWMRRLKGTPPLVSAQAQLMCSTAMLLPVASLADHFWALPLPGATVIAAVLGLAAFSTALAYIVFFRISASAGPSNVMLVTSLIPVSATALGVLVLGERLAPHQIVGASIIACGARGDRRPADRVDRAGGRAPRDARQPPNRTLCMMRPGTNVKRPAITSAPRNSPIMVERWRCTAWRCACQTPERQHHQREDRQQVDGAPRAPEPRSCTQNELMATTSIRAAQV